MNTSRLGLALMHLLAKLPLPVLRGIGWGVGRLLFILAAPRRKIALRNLELCFPEVPAAQRRAWPKKHLWCFAKPLPTAAGCGLAAKPWCAAACN